MGFSNNMIKTIMKCVSIVSYSILINGSLTNYFRPSRGIRQGDHISSYLFILCVEVLFEKLIKSQEKWFIYGLSIARKAPTITHLFFVDESLVFCMENELEVEEPYKIFRDYKRASGQLINYQKSTMIFNGKVKE